MKRSPLILGILLWARLVLGQEIDQGGCVHNRRIYPEDYELCENGRLRRCEEGAWADIGRCDREATEAPRSERGDEIEEESGSIVAEHPLESW